MTQLLVKIPDNINGVLLIQVWGGNIITGLQQFIPHSQQRWNVSLFWRVLSSGIESDRNQLMFHRTCLHLQGWRVGPTRNQYEADSKELGLLFDPCDGGWYVPSKCWSTFTGLHTMYPRRYLLLLQSQIQHVFILFILWHADPLLGNDRKTNN
jgi:hypothetical protein